QRKRFSMVQRVGRRKLLPREALAVEALNIGLAVASKTAVNDVVVNKQKVMQQLVAGGGRNKGHLVGAAQAGIGQVGQIGAEALAASQKRIAHGFEQRGVNQIDGAGTTDRVAQQARKFAIEGRFEGRKVGSG